MPKVIIVGSGAAGTAAALALARLGVRPTILDVGHTDGHVPRVEGNLYEHRKYRDTFELFIGEDLCGVSDVLRDEVGVAKLNAPNFAFVTRDAERLAPVEATDFDPIQSFAMGGLGNAWGAGLYRFNDADMAGFPIRAVGLTPYFDLLTQEIGISGADDDLGPFFGEAVGLQPPLRLSHNADKLYRRYCRKRDTLGRRGVFVGRPRLGVLSEAKDGRQPCDYGNTEFWQEAPHLYTPRFTLKKLIAAGQLDYRPGLLVRSWAEDAGGVAVEAIAPASGQPVQFRGDVLLLAAGAIGTTKIVLRSRRDFETALPLLENPAVQIPFVLPSSIGRALDADAFGLTQLNLIWQSARLGETLQGSLLELTSPMRAEFFGRFPLSARGNLALARQMLPAMLVMQLFYPGSAQPPARLSLREDGVLRIQGRANAIDVRQLRELLAALRGVGLWTLPILIQKPMTGHAIHYAATLPMAGSPGRYQCHPDGRLSGTRRIYVVDSACFSGLPAKNMSLGMMANAMRVAELAARGGEGR
jgi:choline dehydrogenase-like flavoprotein